MIKFLNHLKRFSSKQKKYYLFLLFLSIIAQALDVIGITLVPILVSLIISSSEKSFFLLEYQFFKNFFTNFLDIKVFIILFISFFLFKNIFLYVTIVLENNFFKNLQYDFQSKIFGSYIRKKFDFIQKTKYSTLQRNIIGSQEFSLLFQKVLRLIKEFILLLGIVLLLIFQDIFTTLVIASILVLFIFFFNLFVKKRYLEFGQKVFKKKSIFIQHLTEAINSFKLIYLYKNYHIFEDDFQKNLRSRVELDTDQKNISSMVKPLLEIIIVIFLASIIFIYINSSKDINSLVPILALYSVAALKIGQSLNAISLIFSGLKFNEALFDEISKDVSVNIIENQKSKNLNIKSFQKLNIKNLNFQYQSSKEKLFNNLNLEIFTNQLYGIIGKSGSGKSTLIDIISGIQKPYSGEILLDGDQNINNFIDDWQSTIGYIPQESYILDNSLTKNICFGLNEDKKKYDQIISLLNLEELDLREKELQKSIVGDRGGSSLSGGQRQRISIARALYRDAKILILDEPTSALDYLSSKSLFSLLQKIKKDKMIIIISHEREFLNYFDNYVDLNNLN